jgi:hypothetical protein
MKRINPLLTTNNPAPIPGCHSHVKTIAHVQCCGYLDFELHLVLAANVIENKDVYGAEIP